MDWRRNTDNFVNPYNFVPLVEGDKSRYDNHETDLLTGYFSYSLTPRSPLFIPNTSNENVFGNGGDRDHKSYDFFSYTDLSGENPNVNRSNPTPIIPGSEIRGAVRSVFEAFTNSCMSSLEGVPLSSRTTNPKNAGVIYRKDGTVYLCHLASFNTKEIDTRVKRINTRRNRGRGRSFPCKVDEKGKYICSGEEKIYSGSGVYITFDNNNIVNQITAVTPNDTNRYKRGILFLGEPFSSKKYDAVFLPSIDCEEIKSDKLTEAIDLMYRGLEEYSRNDKINRNYTLVRGPDPRNITRNKHYGYVDYRKNSIQPVWYELVGDNLYLSPAQIGRNVYYKSMKELAGMHKPCEVAKDACKSCNLFGMVSEVNTKENENSRASKIRFTDATTNKKFDFKIVTLEELSSPKPSSVEFYTRTTLNNNQEWFWTYDYFINTDGDKELFKENEKLELRGRKFYWHYYPAWSLEKIGDTQRTKRNIDARLLLPTAQNDAKSDFSGRVYFENITETQLRDLLMSMSLGTTEDNACLKIGHGKPLGLGSIKINIDEVYLRTISLNDENLTVIYEEKKTEKFEKYYTTATSEVFKMRTIEEIKNEVEKFCVKNKLSKPENEDNESYYQSLVALFRMSNFNTMKGKTVAYPVGHFTSRRRTETNSMQWFRGNRMIQGTGGTGINPRFDQLLPIPEKDEDLDMKNIKGNC